MGKYELVDNQSDGQYEYHIGLLSAHIEYEIKGEGIIFLTHTYVPDELRGNGIATQLVESCLQDIEHRGMQLVPLCGFVTAYIGRHPEWKRILRK